jgi:flagellar basal-body rod protein FlgC
MVSAIGSALSGLAAAGKRLEVTANNITNQFTTLTKVDGETINKPYTPQRADQVSVAGGGVEVKVSDVNPASKKIFDPTNPAADANGATDYPNIDLEEQLVKQQLASYDFKANLKTIKVQNEFYKNLLDIIS